MSASSCAPHTGGSNTPAPGGKFSLGEVFDRMDLARDYLGRLRERFSSDSNHYVEFLQIMKEFKESKVDTSEVIKRVATLFQGQAALINEFNGFLPDELKIQIPPVDYEFATYYVKRIREVAPEAYLPFLTILKNYQTSRQDISSVYATVKKLLGPYPELLRDFFFFLPDFSETGATEAAAVSVQQTLSGDEFQEPVVTESVRRKSSPTSQALNHLPLNPRAKPDDQPRVITRCRPSDTSEGLPSSVSSWESDYNLFVLIYQAMGDDRVFYDFTKLLYLFTRGVLTVAELLLALEDFFPMDFGDLPFQLKRMVVAREANRRRYSYYCANLSQLDYTNCKRSGSSYFRLPDGYPRMHCDGRDSLCSSVLNDDWVSLPQGSEDFSFHHMRRNQYEDQLFKCEDERFELDMVIECNKSTIRVLKPICQHIESMKPDDRANFRLTKPPFTIIHLKAISRIYGHHGAEILELLRRNPAGSVPVIFNRLQQKDDEWCRARDLMTRGVWREIATKNYFRSFDHRSFYFRQQDRKLTSVKSFLSQIMNTYTSRRHLALSSVDPASVLSHHPPPTCGLLEMSPHSSEGEFEDSHTVSEHPPHSEFPPEYFYQLPSQEIHRDVLQLILFAAERHAVSPTTAAKIRDFMLRVWGDFLSSGEEENSRLDEGFEQRDTPGNADSDFEESRMSTDAETNGNPSEETHTKHPQQGTTTPASDAEIPARKKFRRETNFPSQGPEFLPVPSGSLPYDDVVQSGQQPNRLHPMCDRRIGVKPSSAFVSGDAETNFIQKDRYLFGGDAFYCFARFYNVIYHRLKHGKDIIEHQKNDPSSHGWSPSEAPKPSYPNFIQNCFLLLSNEMDLSRFEDECRFAMGNEGYWLFTFDKIMSSVAKLLTHIVNDSASNRFSSLYHSFRDTQTSTAAIDAYRTAARRVISREQRFYVFHWKKRPRDLEIRLTTIFDWPKSPFKPAEGAAEDLGHDPHVYEYGINKVTCTGIPPTEDSEDVVAAVTPIPQFTSSVQGVSIAPPFLPRNRRISRFVSPPTVAINGISAKLAVDSYLFHWIPHTCDVLYRPRTLSPDLRDKCLEKKRQRFQRVGEVFASPSMSDA